MHEFVSFNFRLSNPQKINLHAVSAAALYGKGIFTTLAIYAGKPFLWEKHWNRLTQNAARLSINLSDFPKSAVEKELSRVIKKNNIVNARARLTFFDESSSEIWKIKSNRTTSLLITTAESRRTPKKVSLTVSPFLVNSRSPLVNIKSCNYLENISAYRFAAAGNLDEAVRLNEKNQIVSACLANIFWVKDGMIYTPALQTGALAGTTREFIMENFSVCETKAKLEELKKAESVFLTSAGIEISEVKNLDQISYKSETIIKRVASIFKKSKEEFIQSNFSLD